MLTVRRLRPVGRLLSTLRVADVSCDSATLEWKPAPGPLDVVRIEYRPTARPRAYNLQTVVGVDRWTLAGLTRGCEYAARVVFDDGTARETLFATTTLARAPASSLDIRVGVIVACEAHAPPGERVAFEGLENLPPERSAHAAVALWEKCTPELSTDDGGVARYGGRALLASEGPCTSRITGKIG